MEIGIKQNICLVKESKTLFTPFPRAWKNTGDIKETQAGKKDIPIILKAVVPIYLTKPSSENKPIN